MTTVDIEGSSTNSVAKLPAVHRFIEVVSKRSFWSEEELKLRRSVEGPFLKWEAKVAASIGLKSQDGQLLRCVLSSFIAAVREMSSSRERFLTVSMYGRRLYSAARNRDDRTSMTELEQLGVDVGLAMSSQSGVETKNPLSGGVRTKFEGPRPISPTIEKMRSSARGLLSSSGVRFHFVLWSLTAGLASALHRGASDDESSPLGMTDQDFTYFGFASRDEYARWDAAVSSHDGVLSQSGLSGAFLCRAKRLLAFTAEELKLSLQLSDEDCQQFQSIEVDISRAWYEKQHAS